jgi:DNA-binding transcriptional LysR family regulator
MDLHQLRVFHSAVATGSFTGASQALRISQSTVSQHIKHLEGELNCQLFTRVGKKVLITESGKLLENYCEKIFADLKSVEMAIRESNGLERGRLRFGSGATTLIYQLPPVLEKFRMKYPNVELVIMTDTTDVLVEALKAQRLDLVLGMLPVSDRNLAVKPLCAEEIKIAISNQHPLAQKSTVTPEEVANLPFILYERKTVMRRLIDQFFASIGVDPKIVMVMENIEAIKSLVGAGLGASVLPEHAVSAQGDDTRVRLISVANHPLRRHLGLVTLKAEFATAAVHAMSDLLSAELGKHG